MAGSRCHLDMLRVSKVKSRSLCQYPAQNVKPCNCLRVFGGGMDSKPSALIHRLGRL